jgi:hypothetical protein
MSINLKTKTTGQICADAINNLLCSDSEEKKWVPLDEVQKLEEELNLEKEHVKSLRDILKWRTDTITVASKILDKHWESFSLLQQNKLTRLRECLSQEPIKYSATVDEASIAFLKAFTSSLNETLEKRREK